MDYELVIDNNQNGKAYKATRLIKSVDIQTDISGKPSKMNFQLIKDDNICYFEGNHVRFYANDKPIFYGYIFSKSRGSDQIIKTTAYDQLRYLKNKDTFVFFNQTASEIVKTVANRFGLKVSDHIADTEHVIPQMIMDNKTGIDIIKSALDRTLIATGNMYILYDDFGFLTLKHIEDLKTNLVIGEGSLATDYTYKTSIDNAVNQIKISKKDKKTGKRIGYIVRDSNNIGKWGLLQDFSKAKKGENEAQIKQRAENMLKLKNKVGRTLSIPCLGDFRVRAGTGVYVKLPNVGDISYDKYLLVKSVKHKIAKEAHTMNIDLFTI
ncbi:hydrolase [Clostridiaceae bacterium M8S5]|nr:hydrolase [Clostridiaceae bacterium M8S5]